MKKYLVWKSVYEGEYIRADDVDETDTTVSFLRGEITIRAYLKSEILSFSEVTE